MNFGVNAGDVLLFAAMWLYAFWPLLVIAPLGARRTKAGSLISTMLVAWGLAAVAGLVSWLSPLPRMTLISEPLNSLLFVAAGTVLLGLLFWIRRRPVHA